MSESHSKLKNTNKAESGFTLIELSIVLVIIGLIVGGVLVGQDLIKAAEIRATISQIEKYNTAVNTFRNKYNAIPGDISQASASSFGLFTLTTITGYGSGDGNGLIEGYTNGTSSGQGAFTGEPPAFFRHMSDAGFMDGSYGSGSATANTITASTGAVASSTNTTALVNNYIPPAKLGRGNSVTVGSASGVNYFVIAGITGLSTSGVYTESSTGNLTPQEAYNIDKKVDDGIPSTGSIVALDPHTTSLDSTNVGFSTLAVAATNANCVVGGPPTTGYVVSYTGQACSLRIKFN